MRKKIGEKRSDTQKIKSRKKKLLFEIQNIKIFIYKSCVERAKLTRMLGDTMQNYVSLEFDQSSTNMYENTSISLDHVITVILII